MALWSEDQSFFFYLQADKTCLQLSRDSSWLHINITTCTTFAISRRLFVCVRKFLADIQTKNSPALKKARHCDCVFLTVANPNPAHSIIFGQLWLPPNLLIHNLLVLNCLQNKTSPRLVSLIGSLDITGGAGSGSSVRRVDTVASSLSEFVGHSVIPASLTSRRSLPSPW